MSRHPSFQHAAGLAATLALAAPALGQISLGVTAGLAYSNNFDTTAGAGKALTTVNNTAWTDNTTLTGWYAKSSAVGSEFADDPGNTYSVSNGSSTTGDLQSLGSAGATDRALGTVGSGSTGDFAIGLLLQNNNATALTQLQVIYRGEQWSDRNGVAQTVEFSYQVFANQAAAVATNLDPSTAGGSWTRVTSLDFTSPQNTLSGSASDLGNTLFSVKNEVFNVTIPAGQFILLRWRDIDHSGTDHALAIDDVVIAVPEARTGAAIAILGGLVLNRVRSVRRLPS